MQRMQWREALLIAIGNVSRNTSPYASRQAIRDVKGRAVNQIRIIFAAAIWKIPLPGSVSI